MAYGVNPAGFARKRLPDILAEIEESARGVFGPGVVQTAQSPLGQLNGLMADALATVWEVIESAYQSYDPDQAEGVRLEQLGRTRLLERAAGETDAAFRAAITNADRARIDLADIERAAASVTGVTWTRAFANGRCPSVHGLPSRSLAVAVLGGDDADVATAIRPFTVPGVDLFGNTRVDLIVDGYCRTFEIVRPEMVQLGLDLTVRLQPDRNGCPSPSATAVAEAVANSLLGPSRPANGQDLTLHLLRTAIASGLPSVEIVSATATALPGGSPVTLPYPIRFFQMADVDRDSVSVTVL